MANENVSNYQGKQKGIQVKKCNHRPYLVINYNDIYITYCFKQLYWEKKEGERAR